jgi:hypothetical protein
MQSRTNLRALDQQLLCRNDDGFARLWFVRL